MNILHISSMVPQKHILAVCELIHPHIHGTSMKWNGHFLITWLISKDDFETNSYKEQLDTINYRFYEERGGYPPHPTIRTYWRQVLAKHYHNLQIVQSIQLETGEWVAIMKTCWLRIFQRRWKNILAERKRAREMAAKYVYYRSIHVKWPSSA